MPRGCVLPEGRVDGGSRMKIRRLEIQGFKSFADRTVLRFGDGVTGVVGPNGCGKSNIVDAIRWVMGEQSAKHLRGSGMQDVIFAGSEHRGPSGMAEVTITFKNDGKLVPPEYQGLDEISVTRRLFRDGTSEYGINKVTCRLRDILDLFMGTGIGKNAYSIIEQGRIGLIVTAKPDERRAFIEDAAGVSRYKARRKQAERRIEATEQNLLRVRDLVDGLAERLASLSKQAEKAQKYKALKGELKGLELHAFAHRYLELQASQRFEEARIAGLRGAVESRESAIAEEEARLAEVEAQLEADKAELREREHAFLETEKSLALADNNAEAYGREMERLEARRREAEGELAELSGQAESLKGEIAEAEARTSRLDSDGGTEADALTALDRDLRQKQAELEAGRQELEQKKQALFDLLSQIQDAENRVTGANRSIEELDQRVERLRNAEADARGRAHASTRKAQAVQADLDKNRQLKLDLDSRREEQQATLQAARDELSKASARVEEVRNELSEQKARLQSLQEIHRNFEGCTEAVRALMKRKEVDRELERSVHGIVAEVVSAEPRFERAVEAVLGDRLQYVIVNSQDDGVRSAQYLRTEGQGRSTFVPLDLREDHTSWAPRKRAFRTSAPPVNPIPEATAAPAAGARPSTQSDVGPAQPAPAADLPQPGAGFHAPIESGPPGSHLVPLERGSELPVPEAADSALWIEVEDEAWPDLSDPSVCGKMVELVQAKPGYEHVARVLLGDVVVVSDLEEARRLWRDNGHRKTFVTLDGEVLDPVGLLTGGSADGHRSAGILTQKRRIKELEEEVRALENKWTLARQRHSQLEERVGALEAGLETLSRERHEGDLSIVNLEQDLARLRDESTREDQTSEQVRKEIEELEGKRGVLVEQVEAHRRELEDLTGRKERAEAALAEAGESVGRFAEEVEALQDRVTELKVEVAANREKRDGARRQLERLRQRLEEVEGRTARVQTLLKEAVDERADLEARVEAVRSEGSELRGHIERERSELQTARTALAEREAQFKQSAAQTRSQRAEIDGLKEEAGTISVRLRELEIGTENLRDQLQERYQLEVDDVLREHHAASPQTEADRKRIKSLRRQVDGMGPINLTAIEECEEVRARHDRLAEQQSDLEEALASLRSAIRRINKTSRERYVEAFRLVNEKFQQIFPRLFSGGQCSLVMTDESDPLESGIEIMAQPPGKKLQSVNLLSGGEKALTAVSLIFGIFLIKPTPFCLLDEVDAPLDEANVGRYNDMLREMSSISQFILITHNKRTMELPDRLYGVTMEVPGVSKLVPVDVVSDGPEGNDGSATGGDGGASSPDDSLEPSGAPARAPEGAAQPESSAALDTESPPESAQTVDSGATA